MKIKEMIFGKPTEQVKALIEEVEQLKAQLEVQRLTEEKERLEAEIKELKNPKKEDHRKWKYEDLLKQVF
jgi:cell division protein FtsB